MAYDDQNIFARILRGELPAIKVYEDDQVLAFMDIMPQAEGHTLVIPKNEVDYIFELALLTFKCGKLKIQKLSARTK